MASRNSGFESPTVHYVTNRRLLFTCVDSKNSAIDCCWKNGLLRSMGDYPARNREASVRPRHGPLIRRSASRLANTSARHTERLSSIPEFSYPNFLQGEKVDYEVA